MEYIEELGLKAKNAEPVITSLKVSEKNAVLAEIAKRLRRDSAVLIEANALDIAAAEKNGMSKAMIDRLTLTEARIEGMAEGVDTVIALPDPIGSVIGGSELANGLRVVKKRVPIGTIGIIFESRPNVTVDAAALCFKAGNTVILRG
ncbi:MAG: gamma-glutamyl-phosphate reductase, partial [Oscillospiraceae bacterium]|nr:gamma-glutamyl-phosphate reductase [Oscillospiraceae bacterium]